jgi:hypothetical protein
MSITINDTTHCNLHSIFEGFYETRLNPDFDYYFDNFDKSNDKHINALDFYWSHLYDSSKAQNLVLKGYNDTILPSIVKELNFEYRLGVESIKVGKIWSPSYYNFDTDRFTDVEYTFDLDLKSEIFDKFKDVINNNLDEFSEYVKEKFTSYDGFSSWTDNNLVDWVIRLNDWAFVEGSEQMYFSLFMDWLISRLDYVTGTDSSEGTIEYDKSDIVSNISPFDCVYSNDEVIKQGVSIYQPEINDYLVLDDSQILQTITDFETLYEELNN